MRNNPPTHNPACTKMSLTRPGEDPSFRAQLAGTLTMFEEEASSNRRSLIEAAIAAHEDEVGPLHQSTIEWTRWLQKAVFGSGYSAMERIRRLGYEIDSEDEDRLGDYLDNMIGEMTETVPPSFPSVPATNETLSPLTEMELATPKA